ncbi:MAG: HEAT repeat domain-containing protein [Phycisphaerae bacterium]|nr:HEAT repeat domain-containing protein [Phycisphaerae bacterium]
MSKEASSTKPRARRSIGARHRHERTFPGSIALLLAGLAVAAAGCQGWESWGNWNQQRGPSVDESKLRAEALGYLKQAMAYRPGSTVRCQAIEALAEEAPQGAEGWFIEALGDDSPAVRFAACVALGRIRYKTAVPMVEQRLGDENPSVRAAAIFALHRMGKFEHSGELAEMLLYHKDKEVRGNVAMLFGLLGESNAIKLLVRAAKDPEYMVVWQALESRLLLKDPKALGRVADQVHSGREDIRVLAMLALGRSGNQKSVEVLRYRLLREEDHLESRLAAATALGRLGHTDGLDLAMKSLKFNTPDVDPRAGTPEDQIMRVRTMAALALGAMRARSALGELKSLMTGSDDARIQVAAARAILQILPSRGPIAGTS